MRTPVPVPIVVVCGLPGAGKSRAIAHWLSRAPAGERRAVLSNDPVPAQRRHGRFGGAPVFDVAGGCACCVAGPALRTTLLRALAAGPWRLVLLEASGAAVPAALVDALRAPALAGAVRVLGVVTVVDAPRAMAWLDAPEAVLARAQLDAADVVLVNRLGAAGDASARDALCRRLADGPFGGREVRVAGDDGPDEDVVSGVLASAAGAGAASEGAPTRRFDAGVLLVSWRWPPERVFERLRVRPACDRAAGARGLLRARGVWRTAREWYGCELRAGEATWAPSAWRRDSRLECTFADDPAPGELDAIGAALSAAVATPG